jgi:iron(III) transport system permease protein
MSVFNQTRNRLSENPATQLLLDRRLWIPVALFLLTFLVVIPVAMLFFGSVWTGDPGTPGSFTLSHYVETFSSPGFVNTFVLTVIYGFGSTTLALFLSVPLAYLLQRTNTPLRNRLSLVIILPLVINPLITAIAFFGMFSPRSGLYNGILRNLFGFGAPGPINITSLYGAVIVTAFAVTPIMYIYALSAFSNLNRLHEEAAIVSGANVLRRIKDIIVPMTFPALASGFILTLAFVFGLFSIPVILFAAAGGQDVITTLVYYELFNYPANYATATAAALALVVISLLLVFLQKRHQSRQEEYTSITGKGFTSRVRDIGKYRWLSLGFVLLYIFVSTILPLSMLGILSVNGGILKAQIEFSSWTLELWNGFFAGQWENTYRAMINSTLLAVGAATLTVALTIALAWVRREYEDSWMESYIQYTSILSIAVPGIVLAISFVWVWSYFNSLVGLSIYGTIWVMLFAYMTRWLPFGYRASDSALLQLDTQLEEAATISGASWYRKIRDVTLPLAKPGLVAGWQLVFIFSFLELSASILLFNSSTVVVSVHIFQLWNTGNFGQAAVVSIITLVLIYLVLSATSYLTGVSLKKLSDVY